MFSISELKLLKRPGVKILLPKKKSVNGKQKLDSLIDVW